MFNYSSDREQSELLQNWWQQNRIACLVSMLVLLGSISLFQKWQEHRATVEIKAATMFSQLLLDKKPEQAQQIMLKYPQSPYSDFANLWLARKDCDQAKWQAAITKYEQTIKHTKVTATKAIAHWLKAHALTESKQYDKALLELDYLKNQTTLVDEYRGDIYNIMGKKELAYTAYDAAKTSSKNPSLTNRITLKQQNIFITK